jgi:ATP-dependent Lon protease
MAMTGEITVRGKVLPIGGLKEKMLAANWQDHRSSVLPEEQRKGSSRTSRRLIREEMKLHFVESMDEVLHIALERAVTPLPIVPPATAQTDAPVSPEDITH